jgi:Bacterial archaeo-eukaryotic release factor family 10
MRDAERRRLEQLAGWRPKYGVFSAFLDIDPGDRTAGWRVELKDGLSSLVEPDDHEGKLAVRETVQRVLERFDADTEPPPGRAQVGFVEVARKNGTEDWSSLQIPPRETVVRHGPRPLLCPLIDLMSRGRPHPVVAVSAERVRGWVWSQGRLEEQPGWGAELAIYLGHERKAPAMPDPARGRATSSSGHDQFDQRLEENRKRFLRDLAQRLGEHGQVRESELIAIGEAPYLDEFASALPSTVQVRSLEGPDVISEKEEAIAERVGPEIERALAEREAELTKSAIDATMASNGNGATGVNDTSEALAEGRVEHLLLACGGRIPLEELSPLALELVPDRNALDGAELLVELALRTAADVTPVGNGAPEILAEHGGVAALLRY